MKRKSIERMSYAIHSFMHEELELGGGTLLVYAIIHSFTSGDIGLYYGTQDYLSRAAGISISTVKRAIVSLLDKGLIERYKKHNFEGYRTTYCKKNFDTFAMEGAPPNDAELEIFPLRYDSSNKISSFDYIVENAPRPRYEFHAVGGKDSIKMTAEQYKNLLKLVSADVLLEYMLRLEELIKHRDYHPKSPYKTIKEWIYKDAAL